MGRALLAFVSALVIAAPAAADTIPSLGNSSWAVSGAAEIYDNPPKLIGFLTREEGGAAGSIIDRSAISPSHLTVSFDETMACGEESCNGADGLAFDILNAGALSAPPAAGDGGGALGFYPNTGLAITLTQNSAPWACYPADHFIGIADSEPPSECPLNYLATVTGLPPFHNTKNHVVIEADWPTETITVSINEVKYLSYQLPTGDALPPSVYVGFSAGTGNGAEEHLVEQVNGTYTPLVGPPAPTSASTPSPTSAQAPPNQTAARHRKCHPKRIAEPGGRHYYFDAVYRLGKIGGVYARILNYSPWVHPGSDVSAWVMLQREHEAADHEQLGWIEGPNYPKSGDRNTLIESAHADTCSNPLGLFCGTYIPRERCDLHPVELHCVRPLRTEPIGSYTVYTVLWNRSEFRYYIDGRQVAHSPAYFEPNEAVLATETHSLADQMPGTPTEPETFTDAHVYIDGRWQPFHGKHDSDPADGFNPRHYGFRQSPNGESVSVWDRNCQ
jgi:hypothetical protein